MVRIKRVRAQVADLANRATVAERALASSDTKAARAHMVGVLRACRDIDLALLEIEKSRGTCAPAEG